MEAQRAGGCVGVPTIEYGRDCRASVVRSRNDDGKNGTAKSGVLNEMKGATEACTHLCERFMLQEYGGIVTIRDAGVDAGLPRRRGHALRYGPGSSSRAFAFTTFPRSVRRTVASGA